VGIEPQNAQLAALLEAVTRNGADRADAKAVIPAEQDRQTTLLELAVHTLVHELIPAHYLRQMPVAFARRLPGIAWTAQIPDIDDFELARAQRIAEPRHAQGLRAHGGATVGGADIRGGADEARTHHAQAAASQVGASRGDRIVSRPKRSFGSSSSGSRSIRACVPRSSW